MKALHDIQFTASIRCTELKEKYRRPDVRCLYVVERAAAILDKYMQELEETP